MRSWGRAAGCALSSSAALLTGLGFLRRAVPSSGTTPRAHRAGVGISTAASRTSAWCSEGREPAPAPAARPFSLQWRTVERSSAAPCAEQSSPPAAAELLLGIEDTLGLEAEQLARGGHAQEALTLIYLVADVREARGAILGES